MKPDFDQLNLVVRDMGASLAFFRALGVEIPESSIWRTASGVHHVNVEMPSGTSLELDSIAMARAYDRGWREPTGSGTRNVLSFKVSSRDDVDRIHAKLVALGHPSSQPPFDAFWGSRYAIVLDPDGNRIGVMSPADPALRSAPPDL